VRVYRGKRKAKVLVLGGGGRLKTLGVEGCGGEATIFGLNG